MLLKSTLAPPAGAAGVSAGAAGVAGVSVVVLEEAVLSEALLFCPFPEPPLQLASAVIANTESVSFSDLIKNLYLVFYGTKIRNFF